MKWKAKHKAAKVQPKLGDKREVTRFAFFPTKVESSWLWFEKYTAIQEWKKYYYEYDEVVSEGIFTEKYRTNYGVGEKWQTVERKLLHHEKL